MSQSANFSLSKSELIAEGFDLKAYIRQVKATAAKNHLFVKSYIERECHLKSRFAENPKNIFTIDGSMILPGLPTAEPYTLFFFIAWATVFLGRENTFEGYEISSVDRSNIRSNAKVRDTERRSKRFSFDSSVNIK